MAQDAWHPFVGPLDFLIPDDTRELVFSGVASSFTAAAAFVLNSREVTRTISRMAAHHVHRVYAANPGAIYPRAALRATAQRQVARGSVSRALPMIFGGMTSTVLGGYLLAASLPRQDNVNPQLRSISTEHRVRGSWTL